MKNEKINTGDFTEQVTWQKPTSGKSSFGDVQRSFTNYKSDWVDITGAGTETEQASRMQFNESYTVVAHYDSEITNTCQLVYNENEYNITRIEAMNLKRFMRVTVVKKED